jgi:phage terminase small subunit
MALTGRKQKFAAAILAGFSNKDAAIKAGYSAATASQAGSRLVKDKDVAAYIKANRKDVKKASTESREGAAPEYVTPNFDLKSALMYSDPQDYLMAAMNDPGLETKLRIDAAKTLMPFKHNKLGEGGKKDAQKDAAKKAGGGRFASAAPPKLVATGGKKV